MAVICVFHHWMGRPVLDLSTCMVQKSPGPIVVCQQVRVVRPLVTDKNRIEKSGCTHLHEIFVGWFSKKIIIIDIVSFSGYLCCHITVALWWIFRCYIVVKRETNQKRSIRKRYPKQIAKFISVLPCGMKTESKWSKFWYPYFGTSKRGLLYEIL